MIKLNDQATDNGRKLNNHSQSNISLLSEDKTPLRFPNPACSVSPISFVRSMKNKDHCLSQNSNKLDPKSKLPSSGLMVPAMHSPTKSYQSNVLTKKPAKYKKKPNYSKKLNDNISSASSVPKPLKKNVNSGVLINKTTIESTNSGTTLGQNSFRKNCKLFKGSKDSKST